MHCNKYITCTCSFLQIFPADVCGQQAQDSYDCQQLDGVINNRNATRVSNCTKADDCFSFTCNVSGIGDGGATIEVSFPACKHMSHPLTIAVTLNLTKTIRHHFQGWKWVNTTSSFSAKSGFNAVIYINGNTSLDIFAKQIGSFSTSFGVSIMHHTNLKSPCSTVSCNEHEYSNPSELFTPCSLCIHIANFLG